MTGEKSKEMWLLEDEYIHRRRSGEEVDVDTYCNSLQLGPEEERELREALEEYDAVQKGMERSSTIDIDRMWNEIRSRLPRFIIDLPNVPSLPESSRHNISEWVMRIYERMPNPVRKVIGDSIQGPMRELRARKFDASSQNLPVNITDKQGNVKTVEFLLESSIEVKPDGELVFSAIAPDNSYIGRHVSLTIGDEERELHLCSPVVEEDGRIEVFVDLSSLGEGIQIDQRMLRAQIIEEQGRSLHK